MIKANSTIIKFYIAMMDSFSEYLSQKYTDNSLDNPDHFKTVIIQKIVRMFHTLESITSNGSDEVSARCILRGILDSVTIYCFIYQRDNKDDVLFRHYLYALDSFRSLRDIYIEGTLKDKQSSYPFDTTLEEVIRQLESKLSSHYYYLTNNEFASTVIKKANWKYKSVQNPTGVSFSTMYKQIGFDDITANYYQRYLSQFSHGLCLSNTPVVNSENNKKVLFESIPIADRAIQAICNTFPKEEMIPHVIRSKTLNNAISQPCFVFDELLDFEKALIRKEKTLYFENELSTNS